MKKDSLSVFFLSLITLSVLGLLAYQLYSSSSKSNKISQIPTSNNLPAVLSETTTGDQIISPNIILEQPSGGQTVGLPLAIKGWAKVFDNRLGFRLKDMEGDILAEDFIKVEMGGDNGYGRFLSEITYKKPATSSGVLELYQIVPTDRSEKDNIYIPINFSVIEGLEVNLFFGNNQKDSSSCKTVFPLVRRITKQESLEKETVGQLLQGLNIAERQEGYFSGLTEGVQLDSLKIDKGLAQVEFSSNLKNQLTDSCRRQLIIGQVTNTLKQFKSITQVKIFSDGVEIKP